MLLIFKKKYTRTHARTLHKFTNSHLLLHAAASLTGTLKLFFIFSLVQETMHQCGQFNSGHLLLLRPYEALCIPSLHIKTGQSAGILLFQVSLDAAALNVKHIPCCLANCPCDYCSTLECLIMKLLKEISVSLDHKGRGRMLFMGLNRSLHSHSCALSRFHLCLILTTIQTIIMKSKMGNKWSVNLKPPH